MMSVPLTCKYIKYTGVNECVSRIYLQGVSRKKSCTWSLSFDLYSGIAEVLCMTYNKCGEQRHRTFVVTHAEKKYKSYTSLSNEPM